jgi:CRP-like cAMP-binding protein
MVQRGALRLFTAHAGKEQALGVVLPGETCNEFTDCGGGANLTPAEAIDEGDVLILLPTHVSDLIGHSDRFARALIATMADHMRHFVALVGDRSFRHVVGRVAKVLLQSAGPTPGVGAGTGGRSSRQQELADLVGTAREGAARSLRTFYAAGAITMVRGRIVILDRSFLEEAAAAAYSGTTQQTPTGYHQQGHSAGGYSRSGNDDNAGHAQHGGQQLHHGT